jgi:hypothetical protein
MSAARAPSRLAILIDPFERFGGGTAAALGAIISAVSVVVARVVGVRFDGLLDLHFNRAHPPSLRTALVDQLAAWLVPAICFWLYAYVMSRRTGAAWRPRMIDFIGMTGLARLPILIGGIVLFPLVPATVTIPPKLTPALLTLVLLSLAVVAVNVTWLFKGFKNASGLAASKLVGGFIGLVVVVEVVSKLVIWALSSTS